MTVRPPFSPALLLVLWAAGSQASCFTGTANECRQASPVPGADLAGEGYDVVRLRRTGAFAVDVRTWRRRDGTCTLCRNSQMEGAPQRLPRQVTDWRARPACQRHLSSQLYESVGELEDSGAAVVDQSWSAGLDVNLKPETGAKLRVVGTKSKMAEFARRRSSSDRYSFTAHTFQCRLYEYRLVHRPRPSAQFLRLARGLPRRPGPSARFFYQRFLRTYGTHYISGVHLGGRLRDVTALRTCQVATESQTVEEVKDCLDIEAEAKMGTKVQADAKYHACQEARAKLSGQRSFSQEYSDRQVEVTGGPIGAAAADLLLSPGQASDFGAWLSGLAGQPGVVYHVLEPLHHLLPGGPAEPRRRQLRRELEAYILGHAEAGEGRNCSGRCRRGSAPDPRQPCSCRCRQTQEVDGLCCPRGKGWGLLEVTVTRGRDLWGDYAGSTDAYVRARYRPATGPELLATTAVVPNNNNPEWGVTLRLGEVQLGPEEGEGGPGLTVECWDRDHGYDDDLLGSCQPQPLAAGRHPHVCYFSYGSLSLEVSLSCGPHLGGSRCRQYVPQPPPSGAGGGGGRAGALRLRL